MHVAERFEGLLDKHRRPDGTRWTGAQLAEATGGAVPRSYVTNLLKGRIESPGYDKLAAIAGAMGFPPAEWFDEAADRKAPPRLDEELAEALRDRTVREAAREISRLSERDQRIVLGIVRQFGEPAD